MQQWLWQQADWPNFVWSDEQIAPVLHVAETRLQALLPMAGGLADEDMLLATLLQNTRRGGQVLFCAFKGKGKACLSFSTGFNGYTV